MRDSLKAPVPLADNHSSLPSVLVLTEAAVKVALEGPKDIFEHPGILVETPKVHGPESFSELNLPPQQLEGVEPGRASVCSRVAVTGRLIPVPRPLHMSLLSGMFSP